MSPLAELFCGDLERIRLDENGILGRASPKSFTPKVLESKPDIVGDGDVLSVAVFGADAGCFSGSSEFAEFVAVVVLVEVFSKPPSLRRRDGVDSVVVLDKPAPPVNRRKGRSCE